MPPLRFAPHPRVEQLRAYIQDQQYAQAYALTMHDCTPLSLVDAALTWCHIGDKHEESQRLEQARPCWSQAQQLLQQANMQIQVLKSSPPSSEASTSSLSIEKLLVETGERMVNMKHATVEEAIEAHDNMVMVLVSLEDEHKSIKWVGSVRIVPLSDTEHSHFMGETLSTLGSLHRQRGDNASALEAWEEAHEMLEESSQAPDLLEKLAEVYIEQGEMDRAMDSLMMSLDYRLTNPDESPSMESLKIMDQVGLAQEQWGKLDQALECYEKTLLARSRLLGNQHVDVAQSLLNVGRILESQGNDAGSLDLYKAAQKIYTYQLTSTGFTVEGHDVDMILHQLVPSLLEQSRYEEVVAYLYKCLECEDVELDKSAIYYELGKAQCGMRDYVSATVCLVEASKHPNGSVTKEEAFAFLRKVEVLQRSEGDNSEQLFDDDSSSSTTLSSQDLDSPTAESSLEILKELLGTEVDPKVLQKASEESRGASVDGGHPTLHVVLSPSNRSSTPTMDTKKDPRRHLSTPVTTDMVHSNHSSDDMASGDIRVDEPMSHAIGTTDESEKPLHEDVRDDIEHPQSPTASPIALSLKDRSPGKTELTIRTATVTSASEKVEDRSREQCRTPIPPPPPPPPLPAHKGSRRFGFSPRRKNLKPKKFWKSKGSQGSLPDSPSSRSQRGESRDEQNIDVLALEQEYHTSFDSTFAGPVPYVSVQKSSWDDTSQITMNFDFSAKQQHGSRSQEWWWGVSAEGFGRWFPSTYVSQAVQAAEGFLSARAIHSKVRSDPLVVEVEEDPAVDAIEQESKQGSDHFESQGIETPLEMVAHTIQIDNETPASPKQEIPHDSSRRSLVADLEACKKRLESQRERLQPSDPQISGTLRELASLQKSSGQIHDAIQSASDALEIQKLCASEKDIAETCHFLGELYLNQNQLKQALSHHTEALKLETALYGHYSEETAKALNYIGAVQSAQEDFKTAMKCHKEALQILKECRGEDPGDPLVAQTLCLVGSVYYRERNSLSTIKEDGDAGYSTFIEGGLLETIGRAHEERGSYKMAISFFEEKLHVLEHRKSDFEDPDKELSTTLNSLGMLSSRAGQYSEALSYYERALKLQSQLGCGPVQLATARVLAATVKFHLGHWEESLLTLNESLEVLRAELGEEHETVAATLYQTGLVEASFCNYGEAMKALHAASVTQGKLLGDMHPATLRTKREIGNLYGVYEAELDTAFDFFWTVLEAQRRVHGGKHPNIAETLHSLGMGFARQGDTTNALRMLQECYYMRLEFLGVDHPLQATTLHEIAKIHLKRRRIRKAIQICTVVLNIQQDSLSSEHVDIARTMTTKGQCLCLLGDTTAAMKCLVDEALPLATQAVGQDHPVTAQIHVQITAVHLRMCRFDEARAHIHLAQEIYGRSGVDDDHPGIREASEQLVRIQRDEMLCV